MYIVYLPTLWYISYILGTFCVYFLLRGKILFLFLYICIFNIWKIGK